MQIRKFEAYHGGYQSDTDEISFNNGKILYIKNRFLSDRKPIHLRIGPEQLDDFFTKVEVITHRWLKYYSAPVCDGTQWQFAIKTDCAKIDFGGSNAWPHNFDVFLAIFRELIKRPGFARGHSTEGLFVYGELPLPETKSINKLNAYLRNLLRKRKMTATQLADALNHERSYVRHQLKSLQTFDELTVRQIATVFDMSHEKLMDDVNSFRVRQCRSRDKAE